MPSNKLVGTEGESKDSLSFLQDLPEICSKCYRYLVVEGYAHCLECIVEDEPDTDLFL